MIAEELELALHNAFVNARQDRHQLIGVEHLLFAILETPSAAQVLQACGAHPDKLRGSLSANINAQTPRCAMDEDVDTQPTLGFQRAMQRAILHAQSKGKKQVVGADVLLAVLREEKSYAAQFLKQQGIEWLRVASYISHGTVDLQGQGEPGSPNQEHPGTSSEVQVVLYNDDFTPMELVVSVLGQFFGMNREEATEVMLEVHREGAAVCGLYSRQAGKELAEQVRAHARERGYPLRCEAITPKKAS